MTLNHPLGAAVFAARFALFPTPTLAQATTDPSPMPEVEVAAPAVPTPAAEPPAAPNTEALEAAVRERIQTGVARIEVTDDEEGLSPALLEKLDSEQITEILTKREERENASSAEDVIVPVAFFLFLALVVALPQVLRARQARRRDETIRLIVEKGGSIPTELLIPPVPPRSDLRRGVVLTSLGLGIGGFFLLVAPMETGVASLGLIPLLLGLGHLLIWRIDSRRDAATRTP
jgi:hypothetical protein